MQATFWFYVIVGLLTVLPLILFNIRRVFVKKPPEPLRVNWLRGVVILLICSLIVLFLITAYNATLHERYEITLERAAQMHAQALISHDDAQWADFRSFLQENGTEALAQSLKECDFDMTGSTDKVSFQLSSWCLPKYWEGQEGFEQTTVIDAENPVYVMYLLDYNGEQHYYAIRMVNTDEGWLYDWIGNATEEQQKTIKMPTQKNGKWYVVID